MRSFHQSRGNLIFEVLCALVIAVSCAGAWMQTGAWALLPVALVALLYGVVHAFEMARRSPVNPADPEQINFATMTLEEVKLVELPAPRQSKGRPKAPRKGGVRRAAGPKE